MANETPLTLDDVREFLECCHGNEAHAKALARDWGYSTSGWAGMVKRAGKEKADA